MEFDILFVVQDELASGTYRSCDNVLPLKFYLISHAFKNKMKFGTYKSGFVMQMVHVVDLELTLVPATELLM